MGCGNSLHKFENFIEVLERQPEREKGVRIENFQFEINQFSVDRAHQLDKKFDINLVSQTSFVFAQTNRIVAFCRGKQIITNQYYIQSCLKNAILDKMLVQSDMTQLNYLVFDEPICQDIHRQSLLKTLLKIIILTLKEMDLTCHQQQSKKKLKVYFNWTNFIRQKGFKQFKEYFTNPNQ